ncbi:hypothetical protein JTB14_011817 [Gonioctena quinquepunctata]|nr:hypothetical protein JTB14_011817 [Gonioctena quinquepunctata]
MNRGVVWVLLVVVLGVCEIGAIGIEFPFLSAYFDPITKKPWRVTEVKNMLVNSTKSKWKVALMKQPTKNIKQIGFRSTGCTCQQLNCGCCLGINLAPLPFKREGCMNFTYDPDEFALNMDMHMNGNTIFSNSVSAKNPPPVCLPVPIPYIPINVSACAKLFNVFTPGRNLHMCFDFETRIQNTAILVLHFDCMRMGSDGIALVKPEDGGGLPNRPPSISTTTDGQPQGVFLVCSLKTKRFTYRTTSTSNKPLRFQRTKHEQICSKMEPETTADASPMEVKTTTKSNRSTSQISIQEFLSFLKTAYQVQDPVEGMLMSNGMTEVVNWLKKKETQIVLKRNSVCCQTSEKLFHEDNKETREKSKTNPTDTESLKGKLNEVLSEGLLDSVLPYLVQNVPSSKKITVPKGIERPQTSLSKSCVNLVLSEKNLTKRRSSEVTLRSHIPKTDSEVEIHVCDEVKNTKKTFFCNQKLLIEKMGYFAEVTQGQRLEDMDISVHCDIGIFEWLMKWVEKDSLQENDLPQLDPQCVIPILVSAAFLQMEPLLNNCLLFCHENMNEILRTSTNLSCLNDSVLTKLAAMYTNTEVESIKDRKDKIQSRLFTKLIQSLAEPEPESVRGHWCSLAKVFRCEKCQLLITPSVASQIPCIAPCMRLQPDGSVMSLHVRDSFWNINDYIVKLQKSLKTWRKVYWRLWGDAHFLFCSTCKRYFPSNQIGWCRFHPDTPQFFTLDAQKAPLPIGRFPCCGERAYRFQLLENFSGCQFRQHTVCTQDVRDSAILTMLESYRHLIEEEPPQLLFPERLTRLVARDPNTTEKKFICKETFWWDGFEIIPPRPKLGLLSNFVNRSDEKNVEQESSDDCTNEESLSTSSSESEEGSVECNIQPKEVSTVRMRKTKLKLQSKLWQHNLSARSNQDIQRSYEENVVKEMTVILSRNAGNDIGRVKSVQVNTTPLGGIWVRLEADWKESFNKISQQKAKNIFTAGTGKFTKYRGK